VNSKVGSQKSEVRSQKPEARRQKSEARRKNFVVRHLTPGYGCLLSLPVVRSPAIP
jgi:hypothetical protein